MHCNGCARGWEIKGCGGRRNLKKGGEGDAWMDWTKTFSFTREKKTSSIKCKIKTEGGRLQKARQPAVEGAPASRCKAMSEFMQTNEWRMAMDGNSIQREQGWTYNERRAQREKQNVLACSRTELPLEKCCTSEFSVQTARTWWFFSYLLTIKNKALIKRRKFSCFASGVCLTVFVP